MGEKPNGAVCRGARIKRLILSLAGRALNELRRGCESGICGLSCELSCEPSWLTHESQLRNEGERLLLGR